MDESVKDLISALTELVQQLKDTKTGDVESDHPGIIKNAFAKTPGQEEREKNEALAEAITEKQKEAEEQKGRKIVQTISPVMLVGFESKALKQISDVISGNIEVDDDKKKKTGGGFGWLGDMFGVLGSLAATVLPFLGGAFMTAIGAIGSFLGTIIGVVAGPIGLAILALVGIAAFFTGFWDEYQENGDVGDAIIAGMGEVFDWLIGFPLTLLKDLITWSMKQLGFEDEAAYIDENWDEWLGWIKEIFLAPYRIIVGVFESVWEGISGIWDGVKDIFGGIGALLTGDFEQAGDLFYSAFENIFGGLWDILYAIPNTVINWFMELFGFKAPDDEPFDIGDMLWDTIMEIFDWFVLLFTKPEEAFKKIGDWFDRLFEDPVGAFKELLPDWLVDFGVWVYDHTIGPIVDLWYKILGDPKGSKDAFLDLMPDWLRDIASWVWDRTIGPAVELWNKVFGHPDGAKAGFKALFPEWLWNIMEWIYDHTIGPVVGLFSDLFDGKDVEATFRKYLPDWMVDTFLWIKTNVFGGITEFFGKLFEGDVDGALRSILPDWLVDVFGWIADTVFGGITDFFGKLFGGDIEGALRSILPDWLVDFFGWIGGFFSPLTDFLKKISDGISAEGLMLWAKDAWGEDSTMFDVVFGSQYKNYLDKQKALEVTKEQAGVTGEQAARAKDSEYGAAMANLQADMAAEMVSMNRMDTAGALRKNNSNFARQMESGEEQIRKSIKNQSITGDDPMIVAMLNELERTGTIRDEDGKELQIVGSIKSWQAYKEGTHATHSGFKDTKGNRDQLARIMNKRMFAKTAWNEKDNIKDSFDDDIETLSRMHATGREKMSQYAATIKPFLTKVLNLGYIPLGTSAEDILPFEAEPDAPGKPAWSPWQWTPTAESLSPAGAELAKKYLANWESNTNLTKLEHDNIMGYALSKMGITRDILDQLVENHQPTIDEDLAAAPLDDFIMRPGMKPVAFNKGDIILGVHEDNPRMTPGVYGDNSRAGTNITPELINRVDEMVKTLKENKELQGKMLDAMVESGMMDKQGNTVVNNGGNSTVVNNTTVESTIMDFRDRVVGRLTNTGTKYS